MEAMMKEREEAFERWKVEMDNFTKFAVAELQAKTTVQTSAMSANAKSDGESGTELDAEGAPKPTTGPADAR